MKNRLKRLRKKNNYTLADVAKVLGVRTNTISRYETGKREPKIETWETLASFFKVPPYYLMGLSNDGIKKVCRKDLSPELQDMFDDIQDLVTLVVPDYAVERVLTALINSFKYNYLNDGWD